MVSVTIGPLTVSITPVSLSVRAEPCVERLLFAGIPLCTPFLLHYYCGLSTNFKPASWSWQQLPQDYPASLSGTARVWI